MLLLILLTHSVRIYFLWKVQNVFNYGIWKAKELNNVICNNNYNEICKSLSNDARANYIVTMLLVSVENNVRECWYRSMVEKKIIYL